MKKYLLSIILVSVVSEANLFSAGDSLGNFQCNKTCIEGGAKSGTIEYDNPTFPDEYATHCLCH